MNHVGVEPALGCVLRGGAPFPEKRGSGDLRVAALAEPARKTVGLGANERIALGMRDDGLDAGELELVERLVARSRDGEIGELDEEIIFFVERVAPGIGADVEEIVVAHVKIAAEAEREAAGE